MEDDNSGHPNLSCLANFKWNYHYNYTPFEFPANNENFNLFINSLAYKFSQEK